MPLPVVCRETVSAARRRTGRTWHTGTGAKFCLLVQMAVVLPGLAACDRDSHEFPLPDGNGGLVVGLETEDGVTAHDVHFFVFDARDRLVHHEYFSRPEEAALHISYLVPGMYTVVAVLNTGADFMPPSTRAGKATPTMRTETSLPDITLSEFTAWLKGTTDDYSELLTGMGQTEVRDGEVTHAVITLRSGTGGITLPVLCIRLTLPEPRLPDYAPSAAKSRAAEAGYILRCVVELYRAGTEERILHKPLTPALQTDLKTYLVELEATGGNYDLRLWTDYARMDNPLADTYYHTESLKAITIATEPYAANTDAKDAAYTAENGIVLPDGGKEIAVQLQRPLAKYRLVATDAEAYRRLAASFPEKYPPMEELTVNVRYGGFFPDGFNAATGKPNSATDGTDFTYSLPLHSATATAGGEMQVGSDWIFVNGMESAVTATVRVTDKDGKLVSEVTDVEIAYKRGHLTTVRGEFLTAGKSEGSGGIHIDTSWEGEYNVDF